MVTILGLYVLPIFGLSQTGLRGASWFPLLIKLFARTHILKISYHMKGHQSLKGKHLIRKRAGLCRTVGRSADKLAHPLITPDFVSQYPVH